MGLMRMAARTAVVAGTATAVSGRVAHRQNEKYSAQAAEQQAAAAAAQATADTAVQPGDLGTAAAAATADFATSAQGATADTAVQPDDLSAHNNATTAVHGIANTTAVPEVWLSNGAGGYVLGASIKRIYVGPDDPTTASPGGRTVAFDVWMDTSV